MFRDLVLSNGSLMLNFDEHYQLRDVYYPQLAGHNQTLGGISRTGIWVDGRFAWLSEWQLSLRYQPEAMVSEVHAVNPTLGLQCTINDAVDAYSNLLLRRFRFKNLLGQPRRVRLFAHFDPYLTGTAHDNSACYSREQQALVFHRDDICFLLASSPALNGYVVANKAGSGAQGSWRDAEDGELLNNGEASGAVDGTIMCEVELAAGAEAEAWIWLVAADDPRQAGALYRLAAANPQEVFTRTVESWRTWLAASRRDFGDLPPAVARTYRRSLMLLNAHISSGGVVMAGDDSGDTNATGANGLINAVWVAAVMLDTGNAYLARQVFEGLLGDDPARRGQPSPLRQMLTPWLGRSGSSFLRVQAHLAEAALLVAVLCTHAARLPDSELRERIYNTVVRPATRLICNFIDPETGLPDSGTDLWGQRGGIALSTCGAVYSALNGAAKLAQALGDGATASLWAETAGRIGAETERRFYVPALQRFVPLLRETKANQFEPSYIIDLEVALLPRFGLFTADDPRVVASVRGAKAALHNDTPIGGYARNDTSFEHTVGDDGVVGHSMVLGSLWLAHWHIKIGERDEAAKLIAWCAARALPSGLLPEYVDPRSGQPHGHCPALKCHTLFVSVVENYLSAFFRPATAGPTAPAPQPVVVAQP